jgi:polar amino acid transport system substrate-binding protein
VYSKPYLTFNLHLGAKTPGIQEIALLDQLGRARVGIETRFANTDTVRGERSVSWARSQIFYENIRQFADKRVDFILADKDMINQFNKLLSLKNEELIYLSDAPMYIVEVSLGLSKSVENAETIIKQFDQNIEKMKTSGEYQTLLNGSQERDSLLNPVVYKDILRKW